MPLELDLSDPNFEAAFAAFLEAGREQAEDVDRAVAEILAAVRKEGDAAVERYTKRFDRLTLTPETLCLPESALAEAEAACGAETLAALRLAAERIEDFHRRQLPDDLDYRDSAGIRLGHRWTTVAAAGLYVPGGTAAYPSSVLMNALPAKVAGVERVAMVVECDVDRAVLRTDPQRDRIVSIIALELVVVEADDLPTAGRQLPPGNTDLSCGIVVCDVLMSPVGDDRILLE